jgi:DNA-binding transcriptional MerR regulator
MAKSKKSVSMGAAECAQRTGLTVRALRLYERYGLIDPKRTSKGWRCYGPEELRRLNVVVTLKVLGMTLAQSKKLLETEPPSLGRVLQLQLQACSARRDAADKAVGLVKAALAQIECGGQLSLNDLCDLTRSMEMESARLRPQFVREVMNEKLTPDEERAVMTWLAARPADEMKALRDIAPVARALIGAFEDLWEKKVDPAAPEAQKLAVQNNEISVRSGARSHTAAMHEWNAPIAQKWMQMAERLMPQGETSGADLAAYMRAAQAASSWSRALEPVVDEAAALAKELAPPSAPPAQALVSRLRSICADHSLGDPLVYARYTGAMQFRGPAEDDARRRAAWAFLASAIEGAAECPRLKAVRALSRELMNEALTPEEERAWSTWWADHPEDLAQARGFGQALRTLFSQTEQLSRTAAPSSPEAQELVSRYAQLLLQFNIRERTVRHRNWNPDIAAKFYAIGPKAKAMRMEGSIADGVVPRLGPQASDFLDAARAVSARSIAIKSLLHDAGNLVRERVDPRSPEAAPLVQRFCDICSAHGLGDCATYAQWAHFSLALNPSKSRTDLLDAWAFLAKAAETLH